LQLETKLKILNRLSWVFGLCWLISGVICVGLLLAAIWYDGSWMNFFIALLVSAACFTVFLLEITFFIFSTMGGKKNQMERPLGKAQQ